MKLADGSSLSLTLLQTMGILNRTKGCAARRRNGETTLEPFMSKDLRCSRGILEVRGVNQTLEGGGVPNCRYSKEWAACGRNSRVAVEGRGYYGICIDAEAGRWGGELVLGTSWSVPPRDDITRDIIQQLPLASTANGNRVVQALPREGISHLLGTRQSLFSLHLICAKIVD